MERVSRNKTEVAGHFERKFVQNVKQPSRDCFLYKNNVIILYYKKSYSLKDIINKVILDIIWPFTKALKLLNGADPFSAEVIMRYCKYCNTPQEDGDLFCVGCGRSIPSNQSQDQSQDQSQKMTARKRREQGSLDPFYGPGTGEMPGGTQQNAPYGTSNNYPAYGTDEGADDPTMYAWKGSSTFAGQSDSATYGAWSQPDTPGSGGGFSNDPNNQYDNYYGTTVEYGEEDTGRNRWLIPVIVAAAVLLLGIGAVIFISGRLKTKDPEAEETVAAETGENDAEEDGSDTVEEDGAEPASGSDADTDGSAGDGQDTVEAQETDPEQDVVEAQETVTETEEETAHTTVIPEKKEEETAYTADTGIEDLMMEEEEEEEETEDSASWFLSDSSNRYYSRSELERLDDYSLQMAINEIYARHGRKFDTESIREYFEEQPWYHGTISPADFDGNESQYFNEYEKANREMMAQIRDERAEKKPAGR